MTRSFSIAARSLLHHRGRTAAVVSGVCFAVLFIFLELGLLGGADGSATAISDRVDGELILVSQRFVHLNRSDSLPSSRLALAAADPGVEHAVPLYIGYVPWRQRGGLVRSRLVALGLDLEKPPPVEIPELAASQADLRSATAMLVDRVSQSKLGPIHPGNEVEVADRPMRIAGQLDLGVGFVADGLIVVSDSTFSRLFAGHDLSRIHAGVVKLKAGADEDEVARRLRERLPGDTRVLTTSDLRSAQRRVWVFDTAIGNIFSAGAGVAFLVGLVVLYQALATDIIQQKAHYATLKAIGYEDRHLQRIVLEQSIIYAILGAIPAFFLALLVYSVAAGATKMPVAMTGLRLVLVTTFTVLMAVVSGRLALAKITRADPASLF